MILSNYQILQRNEEGSADILLEHPLPPEFESDRKVFVSIFREDDNLQIIDWTEMEKEEEKCFVRLTIPEGGLYRVELCAAEQTECELEWQPRLACIRHVGVGDVYIMAGQSNMAGHGRDFSYDPPCMGVHLYGNNGKWDIAAHPMNDSTDTIYPENAEYSSGTSPALSFGRRLKELLGIPIGLVQASLGGSALESWNPEEKGTLYFAMLRRLRVVGTVKGILWYQGCGDAFPEYASTYLERFSRMTELWRKNIGPVPFLTVQINRWSDVDEELERCWGIVTEAQRQAGRLLQGVYVVPSYDVGLSDGIHNSSGANRILGERMALTAMASIYHQSGKTAPSVETAERINETQIRLTFQKGVSAAPINWRADGMQIEDENGLIDCIRAEKVRDAIVITAEREFSLPARYHAYWKCSVPPFPVQEMRGMPMLACYGVEIS